MFTYFRLYLWFLGQYSCNHLDECMQSTLLVCYHIFVPASLLSLRHLFHILETWWRRLPFWRKCRYIIVISNCKPLISLQILRPTNIRVEFYRKQYSNFSGRYLKYFPFWEKGFQTLNYFKFLVKWTQYYVLWVHKIFLHNVFIPNSRRLHNLLKIIRKNSSLIFEYSTLKNVIWIWQNTIYTIIKRNSINKKINAVTANIFLAS